MCGWYLLDWGSIVVYPVSRWSVLPTGFDVVSELFCRDILDCRPINVYPVSRWSLLPDCGHGGSEYLSTEYEQCI